jgi:hypothetical protein
MRPFLARPWPGPGSQMGRPGCPALECDGPSCRDTAPEGHSSGVREGPAARRPPSAAGRHSVTARSLPPASGQMRGYSATDVRRASGALYSSASAACCCLAGSKQRHGGRWSDVGNGAVAGACLDAPCVPRATLGTRPGGLACALSKHQARASPSLSLSPPHRKRRNVRLWLPIEQQGSAAQRKSLVGRYACLHPMGEEQAEQCRCCPVSAEAGAHARARARRHASPASSSLKRLSRRRIEQPHCRRRCEMRPDGMLLAMPGTVPALPMDLSTRQCRASNILAAAGRTPARREWSKGVEVRAPTLRVSVPDCSREAEVLRGMPSGAGPGHAQPDVEWVLTSV